MNDPLIRILLITAGYWGASFALGMLSGPTWGFALSSAALLYLFAAQMSRLDSGHEPVLSLPGTPAGPRVLEEAQPLMAVAPAREPVSVGPVATEAEVACGVSVLDHEYRLLWCNAATTAHFGIRDAKSAIGAPLDNLVPEPSFVAYLAAGQFLQPLRLETMRCDGTILSVWLVRYIGSQWLLLSLDITQAARLEIKQRDCLDNALHELRAPITVLTWSLDMMREHVPDDQCSRDYLNSMLEQCQRMRRITEDLRNLSALESAPEPPSKERIGVDALLRIVHAEAESLAAGRQRIVLDAKPGFELLGVRSEITSAFSNLAGNAVRYTQPGGEIRLIWRASAAGAEFAVEDTGIGIAKEHIPRLTERFFQVDRRLSRKHGGAGLGLAIVKDVLDRHQAALEVASEPGRGSRFTARFPAHRVVLAGSGDRGNIADLPSAAPVSSEAGMFLSSGGILLEGKCDDKAPVVPTPRVFPNQIYG